MEASGTSWGEGMTDKIDDGGPAFANSADNGYQRGMSLRQWYAGQAPYEEVVQILRQRGDERYRTGALTAGDYAWARHVWADALLAERRKG